MIPTRNRVHSIFYMMDVYVIDYDDCILPTTVLQQHNTSQQPRWSTLIAALLRTFNSLICCGRVVIVTNGARAWVEMTCKQHLPDVWAFIVQQDIAVFSGRDAYETIYPTDSIRWKFESFRTLFESIPNISTFISIGDSDAERVAAQRICDREKCVCKTIKLKHEPSVEELILQWERLFDLVLDVLIEYDGSIDVHINPLV